MSPSGHGQQPIVTQTIKEIEFMRLQKYMATCGVAARRKCEEIIASGRVAVNGEQIITEMGTQVEDGDVVTLDGQVYHPRGGKALRPVS